MEFSTVQNQDDSEGDQKRTMRILREIADTIDPNIQFMADFQSNHPDAKMPVLDMKVEPSDISIIGIVFCRYIRKAEGLTWSRIV